MKRLIIAAAALCLSACSLGSGGAPPAPAAPAPLAGVAIDEAAIKFAFEGFDVLLYAVDAARALNQIKDGSPAAIRLAGHVDTARKWLNAASAAQRAGNAKSYDEAFAQATKAVALAKDALRKGGAR